MSKSYKENSHYKSFRKIKSTSPHFIDPELQEYGYTPKSKHTSVNISSWDDLKFSDYSGYNNFETKQFYRNRSKK